MASLRLALKMSMEDSNSTPIQSNSLKGEILNNDDKKGNISKRKGLESADDSSSNINIGIKNHESRVSNDSEKSKNTLISTTTKRRSASDVVLPTPRYPRMDITSTSSKGIFSKEEINSRRSLEGKRIITPVIVAPVTKIHGNTKKINIVSTSKDNISKSTSSLSPREIVKVKSDVKNLIIDYKESQKDIPIVKLNMPRVKSPPTIKTLAKSVNKVNDEKEIIENNLDNTIITINNVDIDDCDVDKVDFDCDDDKIDHDDKVDDEGKKDKVDDDGNGDKVDFDDISINENKYELNESENNLNENEINELATISDSHTSLKIEDNDDINKGDDVKKKRKRRSNNLLTDDNNNNQILDDTDGPRYQSHRAAAMVAKAKLKEPLARERGPNRVKEEEENKPEIIEKLKSKVEKVHLNNKIDKSLIVSNPIESVIIPPEALAAEAKWVECELCSKWRSLPSHVDIDALPEQWYCTMNLWDNNHNTCDSPEDNADYGVTIAASDVSLIVHEIIPANIDYIEKIDKNIKSSDKLKNQLDIDTSGNKNIRNGNNKGICYIFVNNSLFFHS
jgi:hypothetical protein